MTGVMILEFNRTKLSAFEFPLDNDGDTIGEQWAKNVKRGIDEFAKTHAGFVVDEHYLIRFETKP